MDLRIGGAFVHGVVVAVALAGCGTDSTSSSEAALAGAADTPPVFLDQGWDSATRAAFYKTTQGSRMLPYAWFLNLEQSGSRQKFKAPSNMRRMGFLVDVDPVANPDELPVGFAKDDHPTRGTAIGLTCAGCHTGELEYAGVSVRIDGGQSLADIEQFQDGLLASLTATLADSAKFARFADAVLGNQRAPRRALSFGQRLRPAARGGQLESRAAAA